MQQQDMMSTAAGEQQDKCKCSSSQCRCPSGCTNCSESMCDDGCKCPKSSE